jgi:hypothetical protein
MLLIPFYLGMFGEVLFFHSEITHGEAARCKLNFANL